MTLFFGVLATIWYAPGERARQMWARTVFHTENVLKYIEEGKASTATDDVPFLLAAGN